MTSAFRFPPGFLFGAATSAHQVEGQCTNNDWWVWEQQGRVAESSGQACDHYRRYREDFDLARALGHNAHRFSIEWSRVEPEDGVFSQEALDHYRDVLQALRDRGIEPIVTLHHFTLPCWLADQGGWENPEIEHRFARYAARVLDASADLARWWITINEPMALVFKSYVAGEWPPGQRGYRAAVAAVRNMLRAHVRAYQVIHASRRDALVSVAHHGLALSACDSRRIRDRLSVWVRGRLFNHLFIDGLHSGVIRVPGLLWERLAQGRTLDFIGLNYYTRDFVHNAGFGLPGLVGRSCGRRHDDAIVMRNRLGWEVYPEGMATLVRELARYRLPILITENGVCTDSDSDRWAFIVMHLWQVARALGLGIPIIGYLYWSLLDNFEWAHGFGPRFGLVEVDYATQQRHVRPSAWLLRDVICRGGISS